MDFFTNALDIGHDFLAKKLDRITQQLKNSSIPALFSSFYQYSFYFYFAMDIQHKVFPQSIKLPSLAKPKNFKAQLYFKGTFTRDAGRLLENFFTPSFNQNLIVKNNNSILTKLLNPNEQRNKHLQMLEQWLQCSDSTTPSPDTTNATQPAPETALHQHFASAPMETTTVKPTKPLALALTELIDLQNQFSKNNSQNPDSKPLFHQAHLDDFSSLYNYYPLIDFHQSFYFWKLNETLLTKIDANEKAKILSFIQSTSMISGTAKTDKHLAKIKNIQDTLGHWENLFQKQGRQILCAAIIMQQATHPIPARFECPPEMTFTFMDNQHNNNVMTNRQQDLVLKSFDETTNIIIDSFFDAYHISPQLVNTIYAHALSHGAVDLCFFIQKKLHQKITTNLKHNAFNINKTPTFITEEQVCSLLHSSSTLSGDSPFLALLKAQSLSFLDITPSTIDKSFSTNYGAMIKFKQFNRELWIEKLNPYFFDHWEQPQFQQQTLINHEIQLKATTLIDKEVMNSLNIQPEITQKLPSFITKEASPTSVSQTYSFDFSKPNKVEIKNFILDSPKTFFSFCTFLKKLDHNNLNDTQKLQYNKINNYIKALPSAITKQIAIYSNSNEPNLKSKLVKNLSICEEHLLYCSINEDQQMLTKELATHELSNNTVNANKFKNIKTL